MSEITPPDVTNLAYVEELYEQWLESPDSLTKDWRLYFEKMDLSEPAREHPTIGSPFAEYTIFSPPGSDGDSETSSPEAAPSRRTSSRSSESSQSLPAVGGGGKKMASMTRMLYRGTKPSSESDRRRAVGRRETDMALLQAKVEMMIRLYRVRGHLEAQIDPIGIERPKQPELDPAFHGISDEELDTELPVTTVTGAPKTLRDLLDRLRTTYCRSIGVQFMHIDDLDVKNWLQERMESSQNRTTLSPSEQLTIFTKLTDAVLLEEFIQKKYTGSKSFSLEGGESLIPLIGQAIERAGDQGVDEIVLAMAHRGRLNVLANIMGKSLSDIFAEFDDKADIEFAGDVKYHLGYSTDWETDAGHKVHISLCFNASHLEVVNPVALGRLRAKQERHGDRHCDRGLCILVHGDAAIAGEGVNQETLNLSELDAYHTGGTLHIICNNQIGFTTRPDQSRSSTYCTDVAKMLQIPVFHVNGEDPEAVAQVVELAMDFRKKFKRDVMIDMYCYRRRGHNEADEPAFTQPQLYKAIRARKSVREGYLEHLSKLGEITKEQGEQIAAERRAFMEEELSKARQKEKIAAPDSLSGVWSGYRGGPEATAPDVDTFVTMDRLRYLLDKLTQHPEDFTPHPKLVRFLKQRKEQAKGERPLDWSAGEALAFASLVTEGHPLRVTGQDAERGTFSHRHANLHDVNTGKTYMPLQHLEHDQATAFISNSPLSETAVLGFDYGYSLDRPEGLTVWEAQFGDFANVAQVIVDQFICSAEQKWRRLSGLVMMLPHGFEGMGPEHSSARLERYLESCAMDNMQVMNITTPANYFHALRRQVLRGWIKPMIVMTPKSLLRHPKAISTLEECASGSFQKILGDPSVKVAQARRVIVCTGKVYYDLLAEREERGIDDVAIIRMEQIYPTPFAELEAALSGYPSGSEVVWVQEEPENMGAWRHILTKFGSQMFGRWPLRTVARAESASPATGSKRFHVQEQKALVATALA